MTRKRKIQLGLAGVAAAFATFLLAAGLWNFIVLTFYLVIHDPLFPGTISWDAKNAYLKCPSAIANPRQWPARPAAACEAMYLCVNEGALSAAQIKALDDRIRSTPGCEKP